MTLDGQPQGSGHLDYPYEVKKSDLPRLSGVIGNEVVGSVSDGL